LEKGSAGRRPWRILHEHGRAGDLHAATAAALHSPTIEPTVRFLTATAPALVLGSHQDAAMFTGPALASAGLELARRRSGGSAVMVGEGRVSWVDFVIGADDGLWQDDVGRAAWWVGELWAAAIESAGLARADVWKGPMRPGLWSPTVCFAGLGPGEVTVGGAKVVGVCQRRTRRAAIFQSAALLDWRPEEYGALVASPPGPPDSLETAATGLGRGSGPVLESALAALLMP
jgi:lipoate-protein ligase A